MSFGLITLLIVFVAGALVRLPVVPSMFASGIAYLWATRQDVGLLVDQTLNSTLSLSILLAVPLFILTANVMNAVTISDRLWSAGSALLGRLPGAMGM
jgi:C4-dicarboxylate transporter, DctM subunit